MSLRESIFSEDFDDILEKNIDSAFARMNCIQIGKIDSYDVNTQSCKVEIQFKRRVNTTEIADYPLLIDVPVFVLGGGDAYIDMPIKKGDYCLVLFSDRNIDTWWTSGNKKEPPTLRKHDIADGFALVGIKTKDNPFSLDGNDLRIIHKNGKIHIGENGKDAARKDDETKVDGGTDAAFISWIATVSGFINGLAPGTIPTPPTTVTGKITGGSSEVTIK